LLGLVVAIVMTVGGLVWLLGPWGLLLPGLLLVVIFLLIVDVDGGARGDAASHPARSRP
jgi:hypothetical protein